MKKRATAITEYPSVKSAIDIAVQHCGWDRKSAESLAITFARADIDVDVAARLVVAFTHWQSVSLWPSGIRELALRNQNLLSRMREDLRHTEYYLSRDQLADLLHAIEILGTRKLGLALREGIRALRPLRDLVAVVHLPDETVSASLPEGAKDLDVYGIRSPGFFLGRVLFVGPLARNVVQPGQLVLVQDQSMPYGAGELRSEEFGLEPGRRVILVPCKILKSPERSEELVERRRETKLIEKRYPPEHAFWKTPEGEATWNQLGEHIHNILEIMALRSGRGRNRLMHTADESDNCVRCAFDLSKVEGASHCPRCDLPFTRVRTEAEGIMAIVEESDGDQG